MAKVTANGMEIVAIAALADKTSTCNLAPGTAGALRADFYTSLTVAVTGASYPNGTAAGGALSTATAGSTVDSLVMYTSDFYGAPWVRTEAQLWAETVAPIDPMADAPVAATPTKFSTVIFPDYVYKNFQ